MSLKQGIARFFGLYIKEESASEGFGNTGTFSGAEPRTSWRSIFSAFVALWAIFLGFFAATHFDAQAVTWVVTEDIASSGDVGRYSDMALTSSNLPAVVYYDKTNTKVKYAQRESNGSWTIEDVETIGGDFAFGTVANTKMSIAKDPSDGKMSVVYCNYAYGGASASSQLRYAHRVGGGAGNCGTSNNWQCSSIGSTNDSCTMRMVSLAFHTTSTQPAIAYVEKVGSSARLGYVEYDGSTWNATNTLSNSTDWVYDRHQASLAFSSTGVPYIFFPRNNGVTTVDMKYTFRAPGNWSWQAARDIDTSMPYAAALTATDAIVSSDVFYFTYNAPAGSAIKYGTLNPATGTVSTSTVSATNATWNSVALIGGNPAIAWYNSAATDLSYSSYSGSWSTETASSTTNDVGLYASLAAYSSSPIISYFDTTNANQSFISATAFNAAPSAPTTLYSNTSSAQAGQSNPSNLATSSPVFSAIFNDSDGSDTGAKAQIQVTTTTDEFATVSHWDSGSSGTTITSITNGARSSNIFYNNLGSAATYSIGLADDGEEGGTNTTYYWRIRFWDNSDLAGTWSATATFSILDRPRAASGVIARFTATTSTVEWTDNSSIEDAYQAQVSTDNVTYSHFASTTANETTTSSIGLTPNTLYYLRVRSFNTAGYTASSATSGYTLAADPVTVTASSSAYDRIQVGWGANSNPGGTEYYVLNVTAGTNSGWITDLVNTFTGLEGAKQYSFQVKARNAQGTETSYSSVVTTSTLASTPTQLTATQNNTSVALVWNANGNAATAEYNIENITTGESSGWQTGRTYTFNNLTLGSSYSFRVRARNPDGLVGSYSDTTSITLITGTASAGTQAKLQEIAEQEAKEKAELITGTFELSRGGSTQFTSSTSVSVAVTASANVADMMVANDPGFDGAAWQPFASTFSWNLVPGNGMRTVYMKFRTAAGKAGDVVADSIVLDTVAPQAPSIATPGNFSSITLEKPVYSGTSELQSAVRLVMRATSSTPAAVLATVSTDALGAWSYQTSVPLTTGTYHVDAYAIDGAGNMSGPTAVTFTIKDITPPPAPTVTFPAHNGVVTTSTIVTHGTAEPLSKIVMIRDTSLTYETKASAAGVWSFAIPTPLANGQHMLEYRAYDASNNQSGPTLVVFEVAALVVEPTPTPPPEPEPAPPVPPALPAAPAAPTPAAPSAPKPPVPAAPSAPATPGAPSAPTPTLTPAPEPGAEPIQVAPEPRAVPMPAPTPEPEPAPSASPVAPASIIPAPLRTIARTVAAGTRAVKEFTNQPEVQTANQAVVVPTTAVAAAAAVGSAVNGSQLLVYARYLFTQPLFLLTRRRRKGWGMVYNAITRMPIDLAVVRLVDTTQRRVIQSHVTDQQGRYQFFAQPGTYAIEINKQTFNFPPTYLVGKAEDGTIVDVYTGGNIPVAQPAALSYNIPLDPAGTERPASEILKEATKKRLAGVASVAGVVLTGVSFVVSPTPLVGAFLVAHVGSYIAFRRIALPRKVKSWGVISHAETREPVAKAIVRIFDTQYNKLLETQVTDAKGRYAFLVGKNTYYVVVESEGFQKYTSQPIEIADAAEGALVATDITLQRAVQTAAPKIVVPTQAPHYVPKDRVAAAITDAKTASEQITTLDVGKTAALRPIDYLPPPERIVSKQPMILGRTSAAQFLLSPVATGSRDIIITKMPPQND